MKQVILSATIKLPRDGFPYASQRCLDDPGVAVYCTTESAIEVAIALRPLRADPGEAAGAWAHDSRTPRRRPGRLHAGSRGGQSRLGAAPKHREAGAAALVEGARLRRVRRAYLPRREAAVPRTRCNLTPNERGSHEAMAELNDALERASPELGSHQR